jgi:hypothetical protein
MKPQSCIFITGLEYITLSYHADSPPQYLTGSVHFTQDWHIFARWLQLWQIFTYLALLCKVWIVLSHCARLTCVSKGLQCLHILAIYARYVLYYPVMQGQHMFARWLQLWQMLHVSCLLCKVSIVLSCYTRLAHVCKGLQCLHILAFYARYLLYYPII